MKYLVSALLFLTTSCSIMSESGLKVRVVRIDHSFLENREADGKLAGLGCTFLNEVEKNHYVLLESDTLANLRNRAASLGANVLLTGDSKQFGLFPPTEGRAYKCPIGKIGEITPEFFKK